jgi:GNAT superfamily N-acetyltransferase
VGGGAEVCAAMTNAEIQIREPRESEFAACRMLLPDASADAIGRVFLLAFDGPTIAGAASYRDHVSALGDLRLHVIETRRRQGIGSRLVENVVERARNLGRARILADADVISETAAEPFLAAHQFRIAHRLTYAQIGLEKMRAQYPAVDKKLEGAPEFPASARIVGIVKAPPDQVVRMCVEYLANMPLLAGMTRGFRAEQYPESVVLLVDGQVIGLVLAQLTGRILRVPAWVVSADRQGARVGTRLMRELRERLYGRVDLVQFEFTDTSPTAKLAARAGADIVRIAARFERLLS